MKWATVTAGIIGIEINPAIGIMQVFGLWAFQSMPGFRWPEGIMGTMIIYGSLFSLIVIAIGGFAALGRRKWRRALIGSILSTMFWFVYMWFIPGNPLAIVMEILAVVAIFLVVISKRVFNNKKRTEKEILEEEAYGDR